MVNMAEAEGAAMFLPAPRHCRALRALDAADMSDADSEPDEAEAPSPSTVKRNKRKNFQPRNICYADDAEDMRRRADSSDDDGALDLSNSEAVASGHKRFRKTLLAPRRFGSPQREPQAMDLSCGKSEYRGGDESAQSETESTSEEGDPRYAAAQQYLLQHAFLGQHQQPQDASDLKEYAQNTVKELLEIYGLNSAEVAESITDNVPISNFNSGKILGSVSPPSQPPTPPRTPISPATTRPPPPRLPSVDTMAAKFAGLASNNNRMSLPQNMATILALAAMQERRTPGSPSTSNNESPVSSLAVRTPLSPGAAARGEPPAAAAKLGQASASASASPVDYSRYVRRFSSALECNLPYCKDLNYREHFHCLDCNSRVFVKKEEMIRHFKWHKKRDESLQHGFMRYSPSDDCGDRYHACSHNRKQTHYHCIQGTCDKVYISTSDVQMHANYHRKDSAIIQEGFQRLRATEECRTPYCAFYGQRTTHFHCRRDNCQFTFKNKADMEKHKTYHIKDEQLLRDGFKKFLKPDACGFPNCRFSQVCNHIHCVRDGCAYVLHSSGQLLSHKRKHERQDSEIAYRKFKLAQQAVVSLNLQASANEHSADPTNSSLQLLQQASSLAALTALHDGSFSNSSSEGRISPTASHPLQRQLSQRGNPLPPTPQPQALQFKVGSATPPGYLRGDSPASALDLSSEDGGGEGWGQYPANTPCPSAQQCPLHMTDHYHCQQSNCDMPFRCRESVEGHAKMHEAQDRVSDSFYPDGGVVCHEGCPREPHFHCSWDGCNDTVQPNERFEHYRNHEFAASQNNSLDALFRRKRGRPPKNRVIEVWNDYAGGMGADTPQAIFTSFKLPKPAPVPRTPSPATDLPLPHSNPHANRPSLQMLEMHGFQAYNESCPDALCLFSGKPTHFHCCRQRCFFATDSDEHLLAHSKDFHDNIEILDGFLFFDRSVDCRLDSCVSNKVNRHFHCVRPGCGYSFVRYSSMSLHQAKHLVEGSGGITCGGDTTLDLSSGDNKDNLDQERRETPTKETSNVQNLAGQSTPMVNNYPLLENGSVPNLPSPASRTTVVKASGTFYPLCGLTNASARSSPPTGGSGSVTGDGTVVKSEPGTVAVAGDQSLPEWMSVERHERYGPEVSCSRPFCKLKRKEHYHCNACNQAFSELERLRPHISKHSPAAIPPVMVKQEHNNNEETEDHPHPGMAMLQMTMDGGDSGGLLPPPPPHYPGFGAAMAAAVAANQQLALMTSQGLPFLPHAAMPALYSSPSGLMFAAPPPFAAHHALVGNGLSSMLDHGSPDAASLLARSLPPAHRDMSPEAKKVRVQTSMRILKDEPVPEGYIRFRFNEDCRYNHCGYREHQTHFHCMRQDCGYSFCDKTRFVQHTARHERLDTLMGGDFQQYRANVSCGRPECVYTATLGTVQNKASHFHCLKCDFVCTDTNKVVAHRRHHQKLDSIMAAGFEKFTPTQPCSSADSCAHSKKQTHYHCLSCQYAVLGLSQMTAHKYRHLE